MKQEKWYFNKGIYLKNIGRFWPIWGIYLAVWLAVMPLRMSSQLSSLFRGGYFEAMPEKALRIITGGNGQPILLMTFFFSAFMAMAIFRYLCTPSSVGYYHSLPIRREGLFFSGWLSGITMLVGSNLIVFVLLVIVGASWSVPVAQPAFLWLIGTCVCSVFFFSFATFCAQFTGNTIALPIFYGILSVLAVVIYYIIISIMQEVIYGLAGESGLIFTIIQVISPPVFLWRMGFGPVLNTDPTAGVVGCFMRSGNYQIGLFIAGLIFALLALLVYRKRKSETAEDIVSVAAVRPIFKYGVAFCAAISGGMVMSYVLKDEFHSQTFGIFMVVAGIVFYCAAEMLLKKSFKVFSWKSLRGCAVFTAIMLVLLAVSLKTGFGVENRVPPASRVETASVSTYSYGRYATYTGYSYDPDNMLEYIASEEETIENVRSIHRQLISNKGELEDGFYAESKMVNGSEIYTRDTVNIWVTYQMKNGATVERNYAIPVTSALLNQAGSSANALQTLFEKQRGIPAWFAVDDLDTARIYQNTEVYYKYYHGGDSDATLTEQVPEDAADVIVTQAKAKRLLEAVEADMAAGTMGKGYLLQDVRYYKENYLVKITFTFDDDGYSRDLSLAVSKTASNTIAALEDLGITKECPLVALSDFAGSAQ